MHIRAAPVRQQHRQHGTRYIQRQRSQMQQQIRQLPAQQIDDQLQQVHGLGVAHHAALYQHGVAAEEAAHPAKRQMTVKVDMIVFRQLSHRYAAFPEIYRALSITDGAGKAIGKPHKNLKFHQIFC